MESRTLSIESLYRAAIAADEAFGKALRRVYGRRAGDMRYAKAWPGHPEIEEAWERARDAFVAYRRKIAN